MSINYVMTIAGSDPSGGAGIQADIKTFTNLGVYCAAVITCLTVQNTKKLYHTLCLDADFIREQIDKVIEDIPISYVKIGMLGNSKIIKTVASLLKNINIICDPVICSKSGYNLLDIESLENLKEYIISNSIIITPNYFELIKLNNDIIDNPIEIGLKILKNYQNLKAILIKGGHINEKDDIIDDILLIKEKETINTKYFAHKRIKTINTHGTGCTLSSAITAFLAKGENIDIAVEKGIKYIVNLIEKSSIYKIGNGYGPLLHYLGE